MTAGRANPEYLNDERGRKGIASLLALMDGILKQIDSFEIADPPNIGDDQ